MGAWIIPDDVPDDDLNAIFPGGVPKDAIRRPTGFHYVMDVIKACSLIGLSQGEPCDEPMWAFKFWEDEKGLHFLGRKMVTDDGGATYTTAETCEPACGPTTQ